MIAAGYFAPMHGRLLHLHLLLDSGIPCCHVGRCTGRASMVGGPATVPNDNCQRKRDFRYKRFYIATKEVFDRQRGLVEELACEADFENMQS